MPEGQGTSEERGGLDWRRDAPSASGIDKQ